MSGRRIAGEGCVGFDRLPQRDGEGMRFRVGNVVFHVSGRYIGSHEAVSAIFRTYNTKIEARALSLMEANLKSMCSFL